METNTSSTQRDSLLHIVELQASTRFDFLLESLEKQVCQYILSRAESDMSLSLPQLKSFFLGARNQMRALPHSRNLQQRSVS